MTAGPTTRGATQRACFRRAEEARSFSCLMNPSRHPPDHRHRRTHLRRRRVLALAHPGTWPVREGHPPRPDNHVLRPRVRPRRRQHRRERRRTRRAGRGALGLAIFSVIATSRTTHLLTAHVGQPDALTSGSQRALAACSIFLVVAALIALRATNTRGESAPAVGVVPEQA